MVFCRSFSLSIGVSDSHVPYLSLSKDHATSIPVAGLSVNRISPSLPQDNDKNPVLTTLTRNDTSPMVHSSSSSLLLHDGFRRLFLSASCCGSLQQAATSCCLNSGGQLGQPLRLPEITSFYISDTLVPTTIDLRPRSWAP